MKNKALEMLAKTKDLKQKEMLMTMVNGYKSYGSCKKAEKTKTMF